MSIRVLVVEDEPPLQRSIKQAIESADPRFEVTGLAFNGQIAISMMEECRPDVVITDIRMPVMDGIELIAHLFKEYPDILTVVLSGHQEFEYAKRAMQYGALHYLLKPISVPELRQLLDRIALSVADRIERVRLDGMERLLRNENSQEFPAQLFVHSEYIVFLLCAGSFPVFSMDYLLRARFFWDEPEWIANIIHTAMPDEDVRVFDGSSSAEKIVILALSEQLGAERRINFIVRLMSIFEQAPLPITIAASSPMSDIRGVGLASQMLRALLNRKAIIGLPQILLQEERGGQPDEPLAKKTFMPDNATENRILMLLRQEKTEELKTELRSLFDRIRLEKTPQIEVENVLKRLVSIGRQSVSDASHNAPSNLDLDLATDEAITNSFNYEELLQNMWYIFEDLIWIRKHGAEESVKTPELLVKVDEFIQSRLDEPITNAILAHKFGFAPTYLSKLFRNYKGMSPTEYVIHLRVEKAKQMMKDNPAVSSKEIALTVGYSDPLYFSKIFKKATGVWPTEYKTIL